MNKLTIVKQKGTLGECLGIDKDVSVRISECVNKLAAEQKSMIEIMQEVSAGFNLSFNEWTAFVFSLGMWCAEKGRHK